MDTCWCIWTWCENNNESGSHEGSLGDIQASARGTRILRYTSVRPSDRGLSDFYTPLFHSLCQTVSTSSLRGDFGLRNNGFQPFRLNLDITHLSTACRHMRNPKVLYVTSLQRYRFLCCSFYQPSDRDSLLLNARPYIYLLTVSELDWSFFGKLLRWRIFRSWRIFGSDAECQHETA